MYENVDLEELMLQMREAESLEEQGDIIHYLVSIYGEVNRYSDQTDRAEREVYLWDSYLVGKLEAF